MDIGGCGIVTNRAKKDDYTGEGTVNRLMYSRILRQNKVHIESSTLCAMRDTTSWEQSKRRAEAANKNLT